MSEDAPHTHRRGSKTATSFESGLSTVGTEQVHFAAERGRCRKASRERLIDGARSTLEALDPRELGKAPVSLVYRNSPRLRIGGGFCRVDTRTNPL